MREEGYPTRDPVPDDPLPHPRRPWGTPRALTQPLRAGYGSPIPVVYGARWVTPVVLSMRTPAMGKGWFRNSQTGAWELQDCQTVNAVLGLCEGGSSLAGRPANAILGTGVDSLVLNVKRDDSLLVGFPGDTRYAPPEELLAGGVSPWYSSTPGQWSNGSGLTAATAVLNGAQTAIDTFPDGMAYGANEPVYFGTALIIGRFALRNGEWPNIQVLVAGFFNDPTALYNADPCSIITDLWSNTRYGLGLSASLLDIDHGVDGATGTSYRAWMTARNARSYSGATKRWKVSRVIDSSESAADAIRSLLYETHSVGVVGPDGKFRAFPLDPVDPLTPYALNENDLLPVSGASPVAVTRTPQISVFNTWPVEVEVSPTAAYSAPSKTNATTAAGSTSSNIYIAGSYPDGNWRGATFEIDWGGTYIIDGHLVSSIERRTIADSQNLGSTHLLYLASALDGPPGGGGPTAPAAGASVGLYPPDPAPSDSISVPCENLTLAEARSEDPLRAASYQARWIATPEHGFDLSWLLAQRSVNVRNQFKVKASQRRILNTPGDILQVSEAEFPLLAQNIRVTATDQDARGQITITAEEWLDPTFPAVPSPTPPAGVGGISGEPQIDPQPSTTPDLSSVYARLTAIAADNRLVNVEKTSLVTVMQSLFGARAQMLATCNSFNPPIDTAAYTAALSALLAYARAAIPADDQEAIAPPTAGWNGLGLPGTGDPPTTSDYTGWFGVGATDGKINIDGPTLRSRFGNAQSAADVLSTLISDRLRGDVAGIQSFVGHVGTDAWLSSSEKPGIWFLYSELKNQYVSYAAKASFVTASTWAAFTSAINALKLYMRTAQPASGVTPTSAHGLNMGLSADGSGTLTDSPTDAQVSAWIGYDTAIHPLTFRTTFGAAVDAAHAVDAEINTTTWQRIQNFVADGILTAGEKPEVFREYQNLLNERAAIDLQASGSYLVVGGGTLAAAVAAEKTAYDQALWNLQTYMNGTLGCPPAPGSGSPSFVTNVATDANLQTWLAAGNANSITGDTSVASPSTFRANFAAVYTARATLLRRVSEESTNLGSVAYSGTLTLSSSKAEKDMSNVTGNAISAAIARNNDLLTAAALADGAVLAAKLADNAVVARTVQAGAIGASAVAADAILARHLLVSGFGGSALNGDPGCADLSAWGAPPAFGALSNVSVATVTDGKVGNTALRSASGVAVAAMGDRVPVDPSKRYRVRCWARGSGAAVGGFRLAVMLFDSSGAAIAPGDSYGTGNYWLTPSGAQTLSTAWAETHGWFGGTGFTRGATEGGAIPAAAKTMAVAVLFNQGATGGAYHETQDVRIEEQVSADLIVDGAITAQKVAAGAIGAAQIGVMPVVLFTTDAAGHIPDIQTDASMALPSANRNASEPRVLMDMTRALLAAPSPHVFEMRVRGGATARGFIFNVSDWASTSQSIIAVIHNGAAIELYANNAIDSSWGSPVQKTSGVAAPTADQVLTVHWYNAPVAGPDGNTYRCRVYLDGKLAASFTTAEASNVSRNIDLVGGYAGVLLGNPGFYDAALRVSDCLLGQAAVVIGDGQIVAEMIKAGTIDVSRLSFTPLGSNNIIATINASAEGIDISADRIAINGQTTFGSGYDPTTKETPAGAQAKADAAQASAALDATAKADAAKLLAQQLSAAEVRPRVFVDLGSAAPSSPLSSSGINWSQAPEGLAQRATASNADPQVLIDVTGRLPAEVYAVAARVRLNSGTWQGDCYYAASGLAYSDARRVTAQQPVAGQWAVVVWDLRNAASFIGASGLTSLRLDLGNSSGGSVDLDWVAVGVFGALSQADLDLIAANAAADATTKANSAYNNALSWAGGQGWTTAAAAAADALSKANTARDDAINQIESLYGAAADRTLIDGGRIYTGTVTAKAITLVNTDNLWPNGNSEKAPPAGETGVTDWNGSAGLTLVEGAEFSLRYDGGDGYGRGGKCVRLLHVYTGGTRHLNHYIPVQQGETYRFEAWSAPITLSGSGARLEACFYNRPSLSDAGLAEVACPESSLGNWVVSPLHTTVGSWKQHSVKLTVPAGAVMLRVLIAYYGATGNECRWDDIKLKRMADASLVVDGAVTAKSLTVGDFDNLWPNGNNQRVDALGKNDSPEYADYLSASGVGGAVGARYLSSTGSRYTETLYPLSIPCSQGDQFYFEAFIQGVTVSGTGVAFYLYARFYDASNNLLTPASASSGTVDGSGVATGADPIVSIAGVSSQSSYHKLTIATAPAPAGTVKAVFSYGIDAGPTPASGRSALFDNLYVRRMLTGLALVDGTLAAAKLQADALVTSNYQPGADGTAGTDNEWALYGAKMRRNVTPNTDAPALLVSPAGFRIGKALIKDAWFSKRQAIDFLLYTSGAAGGYYLVVGAGSPVQISGALSAVQGGYGLVLTPDMFGISSTYVAAWRLIVTSLMGSTPIGSVSNDARAYVEAGLNPIPWLAVVWRGTYSGAVQNPSSNQLAAHGVAMIEVSDTERFYL